LQIHKNVGGDAGFWPEEQSSPFSNQARAAKQFTVRAWIQRTKKTAA
jgi:hypothetical protein